MKKFIAMLLALSLVASFAASTMAAPKKKVVKKAVKKVVKPVKKPAVKKPVLKPETPWVPPTPAPVAPAPVAAPAAGMGMSIGGSVGMVAGLTGVVGNLDYSTASILAGTKLTVGGAYLSGTVNSASIKVVTLKVGAKYALDMLKQPGLPVDFYAMGAVDVPVKVSGGATAGSYGLEAGIGANYLIPDFGTINAELGYSALKCTTTSSTKGVLVTVGYAYSF